MLLSTALCEWSSMLCEYIHGADVLVLCGMFGPHAFVVCFYHKPAISINGCCID